MRIPGADIVIECLLEEGVSHIFGYPGGQVLPIYDAIYRAKKEITHILTSHEQGASHAADGYARASGKTGVCLATSGPGATNLVTGIATAMSDSIPLLAITGNVPLSQVGSDSFQEVDITGVTIPITKHNVMVQDVRDLAETIRFAFRVANEGRPGPVLIDIPYDVQCALCEYERANGRGRKTLPAAKKTTYTPLHETRLDEAADAIDEARYPLIVAGGGAIRSGASAELVSFAERANIPVVTTLMGIGAIPASHPLFLGHVGTHGDDAANELLNSCDFLIGVGTRFSDRMRGGGKHAAPRRLLQIDTDRSEIGKTLPADRFILGDAKSTLYALGERISAKTGLPWTGERWAEPARATERTPKVGTVLPQTILRAMTRIAGPDAIVATDVGQHQIWVTKYATFEQPRKFLSSGGMGTMGFGMGAAIGAQLAHPDLPVILVTGDGSFRMNLIELATIKHYRLPVIVVVFHNGALGMVRQMQRESFSRRYSETTTKRGPDIPALANAYGIEGARVRTAEEFETAFVRALGRRIPIVIECPVALDER